MPLGRQKILSQTIAQHSSDDEHLQSINMSSNHKTRINQDNASLLIRLKVRFTIFLFSHFVLLLQ
jgi:hypothetical protein